MITEALELLLENDNEFLQSFIHTYTHTRARGRARARVCVCVYIHSFHESKSVIKTVGGGTSYKYTYTNLQCKIRGLIVK
jgi:hypothetical protein